MEHATHALGPILVEHASYLWLIPALPLLGAVLNLAFGWQLERSGKKSLVLDPRRRQCEEIYEEVEEARPRSVPAILV